MITALSTIHHDGTTYQPGQEIPGLTDEQAATLLACGAAEATEAAEAAEAAEASKPTRHSRSGD